MQPIINPIIIYIIGIIDKLYWLDVGILVLSAILAISTGFSCAVTSKPEKEDKQLFKASTICCVVCSVLLIATPTKETMYAMVVANYITPDNIQLVQGSMADFVKNVIDAVGDGK